MGAVSMFDYFRGQRQEICVKKPKKDNNKGRPTG
jgi:hypothetical protein